MSELRSSQKPEPERPLRVLLAHADRLELFGLAHALGGDGVEVVGEARTSEQVVPLVARTRPDVLLTAAEIADCDGFGLVRTLRERYARTRVVVLLQGSGGAARGRAACEAGAAGCISTAADPRHLPALLTEAVAGNVYFVSEPEPEPCGALLTERELSVLHGAARGLSNEAIGRELWLSPCTVKSHLHRIYAKLDVANRTEAARYAIEHRLVEHETTLA